VVQCSPAPVNRIDNPEFDHSTKGAHRVLDLKAMTKRAARERRTVRKQLDAARETVDRLSRELAKLDSVIGILSGRGPRPARGGRRWRPGRPGRPPDWWREQQARKAGKKTAGRRGRRGAARAAAST
jgi:hypothetical protein